MNWKIIIDIPYIIERILNGEEIGSISKEYSVSRNDIAVLNKIIKI